MDAISTWDEPLPLDEPLATRVTVVIKALNEERHVADAIESALVAVDRVGGEVILADSGSSDRTLELAARYPISIVQLANPAERRCGIGPQLGYQRARGEFVYILDGDMVLDESFLPVALATLDADPGLAGVGGLVEESSNASYQFRGRKRRGSERVAGQCDWLDMGGLYRASALEAAGYFSNRNLHAYEEMELGLRLRSAGWRLERLPIRSVLHHGRPEGNWQLLARRWNSGYLDAAGELLRASLGQPWFLKAAATQRHLFLALALWAALGVGLLTARSHPAVLAATIAVYAVLIGLRARRTRSLADAAFGQVVWQVTALAMVRGFLQRPRNPREPVASVLLQVPPGTSADPVVRFR